MPAQPSLPMLEGAPNSRDLGGITGLDGRPLRTGCLLRSGQFSELSARDVVHLRGLRIRIVCDLRTAGERALAQDRWPIDGGDGGDGVDGVGDLAGAVPAPRRIVVAEGSGPAGAQPGAWLRRLRDPAFDAAAARAYVLKGYRSMPSHFAGLLRELFDALDGADAPHGGSSNAAMSTPGAGTVLVHCVAGKDRTGFVCALLLYALGASPEAILADYLASVPYRPPPRRRHGSESAPRDPADAQRIGSALAMMAGVNADFLAAAWTEIERVYGSPDRYLADAAGLDAARRARLAERFLVR